MADARPFLRYVAVLDNRTRPLHRAWHGTVLPWDHPWWNTFAPLNGWGCRCVIQQFSQDELDDLGYRVSQSPPASHGRLWTNSRTGATRMLPSGIDPAGESRELLAAKLQTAPSAVRRRVEDDLDFYIAAGADRARADVPGSRRGRRAGLLRARRRYRGGRYRFRATPGLDVRFANLHCRRTKGERRVAVGGQRGREDGYVRPYTRREYSIAEAPLEVLTMAMQMTFHPVWRTEHLRDLVRKDLEMLDLALGALFHYDP